MRHRTRSEQLALFARIAEVSKTISRVEAQADAVGLTVPVLYVYRCKAKAAGYDVGKLEQTRKVGQRRAAYVSDRELEPKLDAAAAAMDGDGCDRCGLHGDHICTKLRDYAGRPAAPAFAFLSPWIGGRKAAAA